MESVVVRCRKCNKFHRQEQECRPGWSRRGFLSMLGVGAAAVIAAPPALAGTFTLNANPLLRIGPLGNAYGDYFDKEMIPRITSIVFDGAFRYGGEVYVSDGTKDGKKASFLIEPCEGVKTHSFPLPQDMSGMLRMCIASHGSIKLAQ